jgi:hypothetical protein
MAIGNRVCNDPSDLETAVPSDARRSTISRTRLADLRSAGDNARSATRGPEHHEQIGAVLRDALRHARPTLSFQILLRGHNLVVLRSRWHEPHQITVNRF